VTAAWRKQEKDVGKITNDALAQHHEVDFDLRQLEVFSKVVELGSISRAGQAVGLAQASVSERMANLEQSIGVPLLDRLGRKIVPTKAGQLLYEHAKTHLALKRNTCQVLQEFMGMRQGEVAIGGSTIPGEFILPAAIAAFHQQHGNVVVRLAVEDSGQVCESVLAGTYEFGVVGWQSSEQHLSFTGVWPDELILVAPPKHRWAGGRPVTLDELMSEPFIMREGGSGTRATLQSDLEALCGAGCERFNIVAQLGSSTAVKEAIKYGLGVSILSRRAVADELATGRLAHVQLAGAGFPRSFYIVQDSRRTASPVAGLLMEFLKSFESAYAG
jgi:DNA-binding transcriptional LysR family regulator